MDGKWVLETQTKKGEQKFNWTATLEGEQLKGTRARERAIHCQAAGLSVDPDALGALAIPFVIRPCCYLRKLIHRFIDFILTNRYLWRRTPLR